MDGLLTYLSITKDLFNKQSVSPLELRELIEEEGIKIQAVSGDKIPKQKDKKPFKSYICYGEGSRRASHPIIFFNSDYSHSKVWFFLGHELGHHLLHPFLPEYSSQIGLMDEEDRREFLGLLELEADYFSNILLVPDSFFSPFKEQIVDALINNNSSETIKLKKLIFTSYLKEVCNILNCKTEELPERAKINLMVRINRIFHHCEEELVILFERFDFSSCEVNQEQRPYSKYIPTE